VVKRNGKLLARKGGLVSAIKPLYIMLFNYRNGVHWSVQRKELVLVLFKKTEKSKKKANPEKNTVEDTQDKELEFKDFMKKLYYDDKNYFGRDKLYGLAKTKGKEEGVKVTRALVSEWLNNQ